MDLKNRIATVYGYAVCLVCVITFLIATSSLVGAIFELSDPLHSRMFGDDRHPSLASFDNYKMDVTRGPREAQEAATLHYMPDDKTLHTMYDAAKSERMQVVKFQAYRTITVASLVIGLCVVFFAIHWIWVQRLGAGRIGEAQTRMNATAAVI